MAFSPADVPLIRLTHYRVLVNGVHLHVVEAGQGPLVILLHGFPEFWYSWRYQIAALAAAGFRVLAPDLRGYNESAKPPAVRDYSLSKLVDDVRGLISQAGGASAAVAGHDWGGGIAWALAMRYPEVVRRLVILNSPHPAAFLRELRTPGQLWRSWYMFFFQLPLLPELLFSFNDFALLERTLRHDPVRPDTFSEQEIRLYKQALSKRGALTAAINYYRAAFRRFRSLTGTIRTIQAPTLLIWGERDRYLNSRLTQGLEWWVPNLQLERIPDASHWVQSDAPERVNRLMVKFLDQGQG